MRESQNIDNLVLNDKKVIRSWAFFDWANSAFALVITAAIFPAYFVQVTDDTVLFLGREYANDALYSYAISVAYAIIMILSPILSGIADYGGKRMLFMRIFTTLGALASIALYWFEGTGTIAIGTVGFILGMVGFAGGQVFYNSYLPVIVTDDQYDRVSAKGFIFGYIGSIILLLFNLAMIMKPEWFGIADGGKASRIGFVAVGLWWLGFSLIPFSVLPIGQKQRGGWKMIGHGFGELRKVWDIIKGQKNILSFLASFSFYSAGVQTVLFLAGAFAEKELNFETSELIQLILVLQLVGIGGAWLFSRVSDRIGNKITIIIMLAIWALICIVAYMVTAKGEFYAIAAAVGLVMGGIQALSRSTYAKLLPIETEDTASFFSFYEVMEKFGIIVGTVSFGLISEATGSMKMSILVLGGFFIVGILFMSFVKVKHVDSTN